MPTVTTVRHKSNGLIMSHGDKGLLDAYRRHPGMVVVKEDLSTFYYTTAEDANALCPPKYPMPATLEQVAFSNFHNTEHWWHWEWTKRRIFHSC